jgi:hypothetical protein
VVLPANYVHRPARFHASPATAKERPLTWDMINADAYQDLSRRLGALSVVTNGR